MGNIKTHIEARDFETMLMLQCKLFDIIEAYINSSTERSTLVQNEIVSIIIKGISEFNGNYSNMLTKYFFDKRIIGDVVLHNIPICVQQFCDMSTIVDVLTQLCKVLKIRVEKNNILEFPKEIPSWLKSAIDLVNKQEYEKNEKLVSGNVQFESNSFKNSEGEFDKLYLQIRKNRKKTGEKHDQYIQECETCKTLFKLSQNPDKVQKY